MEPLSIVSLLLAVAGFGTAGFIYTRKKTQVDQSELKKLLKEKTEEIKKEKQSQLDEFKKELQERFATKEKDLQEQSEMRAKIELDKQRLKIREELAREEEKMRSQMLQLQVDLTKKQEELTQLEQKLHKEKEHIAQARAQVAEKEKTLSEEYAKKLEKVSKLSSEEARKNLMKQVEQDLGLDLLEYQKKALERTKETINSTARELVLEAIQRCSSEVANEATITAVKLTGEADKGKIIGKGGRNIQWLEKTLGVEIIIDDTPDVVTISGFNSIRRHVAKKALEMLLLDGRVHPGSIEEAYEKAKNQISDEITEAGREAVESLGIIDFPEKLIRIIGRLKFRTSYGQNILKHSVEMARLARLLAQQINEKFSHLKDKIDTDIVVKGALLHDIGKALDEEGSVRGDHVSLGAKVADTFGLDWRIKKSITAHHDESYVDSEKGVCLEAIIVDACDNISGGRPGARKESVEAFYQRVEALEKIAEETPGVSNSWVMKGSRELWVFFDTKEISPAQMHTITKQIAHRIQTEVKYPGEIKVVGLWEDRVVEYAN